MKENGELKYEKFENRLFSQESLTDNILEEMKIDRVKTLFDFANLDSEPNREQFIEDLKAASIWQKNEYELPIMKLSGYIFADVNSYLMEKKNRQSSLYEIAHDRFASVAWNGGSLWIYWMQYELMKAEYWPKIEKLLNHIRDIRESEKSDS